MQLACLLGSELNIVEPGGSSAVLIGDQFHQQDTVGVIEGLGHADPCRGESVQRVDLGAAPRLLDGLSTVP